MNLKKLLTINPEYPPAALTTGLTVFLAIIYTLSWFPRTNLNESWSLNTDSLFHLKTFSKLSTYPLIHLSLLHLLCNVFAIFVPLTIFETNHGTIYTGVILNLLAIFTGVFYCFAGTILYPNVSIAGASGWCFTFWGYFALQESRIRPRYENFAHISGLNIPTVAVPIVMLFVIAFLVPGSSFPGHALGLMFGYLMGWKENWVAMIVPPSWIIVKIEKVVDKLIALIPFGLTYYKEENMDRSREYNSVWTSENSLLPLTNEVRVVNTPAQGGRVLGTL
ncbi:putative rhomboid protease RBD2 NDAI_0F01260 [Naumovozyma dairenensis CBS 421]|uniref:Rhomboid-type serine protease 2 n=1 Tax=Naumovozyma dairenensis (strain ATCC 10597 / BCRC 20456 / CBS 421 / NBRC 0211 / NRRL Y-12639) TaxID=1071378 RepID=G0WCD4_NAUDC|nr:hypothetical protein NDAI_0F01260 [Naumovozyma dairenensis CBS 421]CCD25445.1 hypothetical protein NDAI_0F01260 [Naumovozyma dairenensis CBS 421]